MKRLLTVIIIMSCCVATCFAQTEQARQMKAKADAMGREKYLKTTDFSDVDSVSMSDLGVFFYLEEDYRSAALCWEITLGKLVRFGDNYGKKLEALAYIYSELGDERNLNRIMQLVKEHNEHEMTLPCYDYRCKIERAEWLSLNGDEAGVRQMLGEARVLCTHDSMHVNVDEAYARILFELRDFEGSARYYSDAATRRRTLYGATADMADDYYHGAIASFAARQLEMSIQMLRSAIGYYENDTTTEGRSQYLTCLETMVRYIKFVEGNDTALVWCDRLVAAIGADNQDRLRFADALMIREGLEVNLGRYDDASRDINQAIEIYKVLDLDVKIANAYSELVICHTKAGNEEAAMAAEVQAIASRQMVYRRLLREELSSIESTALLSGRVYANSLNVIASCYAELDSCAKSVEYYGRYVEVLRKMLREQFIFMGSEGRMRVWSEQAEHLDQVKTYLFAALNSDDNACRQGFAGVLYDLELISKGIMLNSSIEFESVLNKSKNKKLLKLYGKIKRNAAVIEQMRERATEADLGMLNKLVADNELLEIELMKGCAEYDDYTRYLSYTWRDVQQHLQADDIAIEFTNYDESPLDEDRFLIALTLKSEGEPDAMIVSLKKYIDMMKSIEDLYDDGKYYDVFWRLLDEEIAGRKRIFFAPNTMLSDLAVEYMMKGDKPMSEVYEMHRMSSTKELCRNYGERKIKKAALFGNIRYSRNQKRGEASVMRDAVNFGPLENSEVEMDGVAAALKGGKIKVSRSEWEQADERHFRAIDQAGYDIIHISTHGAYLGDKDTEASEAMNLSILAFADINDLEQATDENNDGVLYASDVAAMNLRGCDLAVLSACETARGASGDDGVFGLQRGFKNAGVHSLMMSIKPVYDRATALLMVYFYENITKGMGKRQALVAAQSRLRAEGYREGKYWAMFIIIDD